MADIHEVRDALLALGWHIVESDSLYVRVARPEFQDVLVLPADMSTPGASDLLAAVHRRLQNYRSLGAAAERVLARWEAKPVGATPFGTRLQDGRFVPSRQEQAALARMQELRGMGYSLRRIGAILDEEGLPPRRAKKWTAQVISEILIRSGN